MKNETPLRLMFYDRTCTGRFPFLGLTHAWMTGAVLYHRLGRIDGWQGVSTWTEALTWLSEYDSGRQISEIQFWGHGEWGGLWMDDEVLGVRALEPGHEHYERLRAIKSRLVRGGDSLWWFRTCDTFGTRLGHDFARQWSRFFDCRAAGHTHTINFWQSGLREIAPGEEPCWSEREAMVLGSSHGRESGPGQVSTISCLHGTLPSQKQKGR